MTTNIYKTERVPKAYNGKTFEKFCIFYYYCALFKQCYLKKKYMYLCSSIDVRNMIKIGKNMYILCIGGIVLKLNEISSGIHK